jgi:RNA polymerase sigma factor FliA
MLHDHSCFSNHQRIALSSADLVKRHNSMVRKIAWNVYSRVASTIELQDLVQIGLVALIECADTYQDRGFAFTTYAATRVRGAMLDALRKAAPLSRSAMANKRNIAAARTELEQQHMRTPTAQEIAAAMDVDVAEYYRQLGNTQPAEGDSIDAIYSDQDSRFADPTDSADGQLISAQTQQLLNRSLATLSERDAAIIRMIFVEEWNLEKIGQTLGIGAARVCQIKKAALQKLRREMEPAL